MQISTRPNRFLGSIAATISRKVPRDIAADELNVSYYTARRWHEGRPRPVRSRLLRSCPAIVSSAISSSSPRPVASSPRSP